MPVEMSSRPVVVRKLRGSEGEISVVELNRNKWLADGVDWESSFSLGSVTVPGYLYSFE